MPIVVEQEHHHEPHELTEAELIAEAEAKEEVGFGKRILDVKWGALIRDFVPVTRWLPHYNIADLPYDIVAGITVGLTLVPQCLSYAAICNVRSEFGLYTSFFGQFVYFIFGTSKDGSVGPTAITSMMMGMVNAMFNPLVDQGDNTYNALIVFISGLVLIGIGLLKLGFIVSLFSIPVVSGFTTAAGFVILGSQVKLFFGLKWAPNDSPGTFVKQMKNIYDRRDEIKPMDCLCGVLVMIVLFMFQYTPLVIAKVKEFYWSRKGQPIPAMSPREAFFMQCLNLVVASRNVIVFVVSTGVAYHFYLQDPVGLPKKLSLVGFIKPGLPSWQFPATSIEANRSFLLRTATPEEMVLIPNETIYTNTTGTYYWKMVTLKSMSQIINDLSAYIIIIPLMTMLESFAITKALGRKNGYQVNPTNELLSLGLANFLQSFINAFPATTTISRCALNDQCKVKTQLASLISATIVIITLVVLTPLFYYIPKPCLAGIMICAGYNLVDINIILHMWRESYRDVFILLGAFVLCLFYDIAYGILICVLLNMVIFLRPIIDVPLHLSHRPMIMKTGLHSDQHMVTIIKIPHGMEYPSCDRFIEEMSVIIVNSPDKNIVINCEFIYRVDYSGIQAFRALVLLAFRLKKHLIFTHLSEEIAKKFHDIGLEHFNHVNTVDEAVHHHHWASKLGMTGAGSLAHISSLVAPGGTSLAEAEATLAAHMSHSNLSKADLANIRASISHTRASLSHTRASMSGAAGRSRGSRSKLSLSQSMAKLGHPMKTHLESVESFGSVLEAGDQSADEEEVDKPEEPPVLGKPITNTELGTSWQHGGGLFSASLSSMYIAATLAPADEKVVKEWQRTASQRHLSVTASQARLAEMDKQEQQQPQQQPAEDAPYTEEEEEYIRQMIAIKRRKSSGIDFTQRVLSRKPTGPVGLNTVTEKMGFPAPAEIELIKEGDESEASTSTAKPSSSKTTGSGALKSSKPSDKSIQKIEEGDETEDGAKREEETKT